MRNGMAMCRADGSSNVIYLGIRYQENKKYVQVAVVFVLVTVQTVKNVHHAKIINSLN